MASSPFPTTTSPPSEHDHDRGDAALEDTGSAPTPGQTELFARVVQGAHEAIDRLAAGAEPHVRSLQDGMASARAALRDHGGEARDLGEEWTQSLRGTVRDHPLAAVAAAVALGALLARLSR